MNYKKYISIIFISVFFAVGCQEDNSGDENGITDPGTGTGDEWTLVWQDEFEGNIIDPFKWGYEVNSYGGGNNELQYYTNRGYNSYVSDGYLNIIARKEVYTGSDNETRSYTSARLRTLNKGDWLYGKFSVRAKLPYGQGLWPAIWMLPSDYDYGVWAASGEIDIMELIGHETDKVYGTLHYGGEYPNNTHTGDFFTLDSSTFAADFHVFTVEWEEGEIRWYVDDIHYQTQTDWYSVGNDYPAPFDKRFHLILNVAVGGNWPGNPDASTIFPQTMVVDWVRVYQKNN